MNTEGECPKWFPKTLADFSIESPDLIENASELMAFYQLPEEGDLKAQRRLIAKHIGLKYLEVVQ